MNACLNPSERHLSPETALQGRVCPEPHCGFLLAGAVFGPWQVTTLLKHADTTDLYFAQSREATGGQALVRVLKPCTRGALTRLERLLTLQHPHIHPLHYVGWLQEGHSVYLLSRYEALGSLARYLESGARLSFPALLTISQQIAQALHHAHERYIIHGHLKPENCLVVGQERIQVTDFYHTLLIHDWPGTPPLYSAPEQQHGMPLPASDQYALAMFICRFLSSQREERGYPGTTRSSQRFVIDALATLPPPLQQVLMRALAQQPEERFPTIRDFAIALQRAASAQARISGPLSAQPALPPARRISTSGPLPAQMSPMPMPPSRTSGPLPTPSQSPSQFLPPGKIATLSRLPGHTEAVTVVRWAPDGSHLATAGADQSVRIWYIRQRVGTPLATLTENESTVTALSWSANGRLLASAAVDATLRTWSISPAPKFEVRPAASWWGHDGQITALDWSHEGLLLASGGKDRMIRLWDQQGNSLSSWQMPGRSSVTALAWSPAQPLIATGGSDGTIQLWNATSGAQVGGYSGHNDEVRRLCWSADGRLLASSAGKKDLRVCLWDTQTGRQVAELEGHTREITGLLWPRGAPWLASLSADRTLRCWRIGPTAGAARSAPLPLETIPLAADTAPGQSTIAIGTAEMQVHILQWSS